MAEAKKTKLHPIQWGLLVIPAAGAVWFAQPLLIGFLGVGSVIGWGVCLILAALILFVPGMIRKGGRKRVAGCVITGIFLSGVLWCGYLTVLMLSASANTPPDSATVVVLGCLVRPDGTPSRSLQSRIDRAAVYLQEHPEAVCIVSGAQGSVEPETEASVMARELIARGIAPERIIQEDESFDTQENMANSAKLIEELGLSREVAVVTDDYHEFRAGELAKDAGLIPYAVPAQSIPHLFPANYGRELVSLTKFFVEKWI